MNKDDVIIRKFIQIGESVHVFERKWIGLTEVEIIGMTCDCEKITMDCMIDFANSIQEKLKEINE